MKHFGTKFTSLFFALVLIVFSVTMVSADDSNGENKNDGSCNYGESVHAVCVLGVR